MRKERSNVFRFWKDECIFLILILCSETPSCPWIDPRKDQWKFAPDILRLYTSNPKPGQVTRKTQRPYWAMLRLLVTGLASKKLCREISGLWNVNTHWTFWDLTYKITFHTCDIQLGLQMVDMFIKQSRKETLHGAGESWAPSDESVFKWEVHPVKARGFWVQITTV